MTQIIDFEFTSQNSVLTNHILPHLQLLNAIVAYEFSSVDNLLVIHFSQELNAQARDFVALFLHTEVNRFYLTNPIRVAYEDPETVYFDQSISLNYITSTYTCPEFLEINFDEGGVTPISEFCDALQDDAQKIAVLLQKEFDSIKSTIQNACVQ